MNKKVLIYSLIGISILVGCRQKNIAQKEEMAVPEKGESKTIENPVPIEEKENKSHLEEKKESEITIENETTTAASIRAVMKEIDTEDILLVNKDHPLKDDYKVELKWLSSGREQVAACMYDELVQMLSDGSEEGREFVVSSGYRSPTYQQRLWDETIKEWKNLGMSEENAIRETSKTLAYPGESEHATGLAVDIVSLDYQDLDARQQYTSESVWLRENCHKYGFILRYPEGKEKITGIQYESWHFRYVGKEIAACIMENGITLEEFVEMKDKL